MSRLGKKIMLLLSIVVLSVFSVGVPKVNVQAQTNEIASAIAYACKVDGSSIIPDYITIDMIVTPKLSLPKQAEANSQIDVANNSADISIDLTGVLNDLRSLINPFNGEAKEFWLEANGQEINFVGEGGVAFPETSHEADDTAIHFSIPGEDFSLAIGEEDLKIEAGTIKASIITNLATLSVTCEPQTDSQIATIQVANDDNKDTDVPEDDQSSEEGDKKDEPENEEKEPRIDEEKLETNPAPIVEEQPEVAGDIAYTCKIMGSSILPEDVAIAMNVSPRMSLPEAVKPDTKFTVRDVTADISISLTGVLNDLRALINPFNGKANEFMFEVNGEKVNIVGEEGARFPETNHGPGDEEISFTVKANHFPVTSGKEDVEIHAGAIQANIESKLATLTVACNPVDGENTLVGFVKVSEEAEDIVEPIDSDAGDAPKAGAKSNENNQGGEPAGTQASGSHSMISTNQGIDQGKDSPGKGMPPYTGNHKLPTTATIYPLLIVLGIAFVFSGGYVLLKRRKNFSTE